MSEQELLAALKHLKVQTGSLACLGCGHEHNCSTKGCAILREAIAELEKRSCPDYVAPVRHAHWVYNDGLDIECSACHADALANPASGLQVRSDYCHRCGAIMDEEIENEC